MKKNKILEEVYLNKMDLGNSYVDDILRLIRHMNIRFFVYIKIRWIISTIFWE